MEARPRLQLRHGQLPLIAGLAISIALMVTLLPSHQYLKDPLREQKATLNRLSQATHQFVAKSLLRTLKFVDPHRNSDTWVTYELNRQIGDSLYASQEYIEAETFQSDALLQAERLFGPESRATLDRLGAWVETLYFLDHYSKAIPHAERALDLSRHLYGDTSLETARHESALALLYAYSHRDSDSLTLAYQALQIRIKIQGLLHEETIEQMRIFAEAGRNLPLGIERGVQIDKIALALSISALGWESIRTETILNDIEWFLRQQNDCQGALPYAMESLDLTLKLEGDDTSEAANRFHSLGTAYYCIGDLNKAIQFTDEALRASIRLFGGRHSRVAYLEAELADWNEQAGLTDRSRKHAKTAIEILDQSMGVHHPNAPDVFDFVATAALHWDVQWSRDLSVRYLNALQEEVGADDVALADPLINLANAEMILGNIPAGLRHAERAAQLTLAYAESHHQLPDEDALDTLVLAELSSGLEARATVHALMALQYAELRSGLHHPYTSHAYQQLASALRKQQPRISIALLKRALQLELQILPPDPRSEARIRTLNDLIIPHCHRLRSWLEEDRRSTEIISGNDQDACTRPPVMTTWENQWFDRYDEQSNRRIALDGPIRHLKRQREEGSVIPKDLLLVQRMEERVAAQNRTLETLIKHPQWAKEEDDPLLSRKKIEAIRKRLRNEPSDTAWLHYGWISNQILITLVTRHGVEHFRQPLKGVIPSWVAPMSPDDTTQAQALYRLLIQPIRSLLEQEGIHALLMDAESRFRGLPFAALHDGRQFLIDTLSMSMLMGSDRRGKDTAAPESVALFGLSNPPSGFKALPEVRRELESIMGLAKSKKIKVATYRDDALTQDAIRTSIQSGDEILNLSTHYLPSHGNESFSSLLLGDGRYLTPNAFSSLLKNQNKVTLITLSACETGPSLNTRSDAQGEDLMTQLSRAGVPNVIGTLWPIRDEDSFEFMTRFYGHYFEPTHSIREAFHQTQRQLAIEKPSSNWAAFTLIQR